MNEKIKLLIFGSRKLKGEKTRQTIKEFISKLQPDEIVTSEATAGVCEIAREEAKAHNIALVPFPLEREKYAAGAYEHRSKEAIKYATHIVFIHDGVSKGTMNEIKIARKFGKSYEYIRIYNTKDGERLAVDIWGLNEN